MKLKYLAKHIDERHVQSDTELLSVSKTKGVVPRSEVSHNQGRAEDISHYKTCRPGDLVINRMAAYQGALGIANQFGAISPDYMVLRFGNNLEPRYVGYLFKSSFMANEMSSRVKGIGSIDSGSVRTPRLSWTDLGEVDIQVPQIEEQKAIADFLDRELAYIELLLGKQKTLVETLQERNKTLILRAISGLNSIEQSENAGQWFGAIPDYWVSGRLSRFAQVTLGKMVEKNSADTQRGELHPYLRAASVQPGGLLVTDEPNYMPFTNAEIGKLSLASGDVVVVEGGAGFGRSAYLPAALEGWGFQNSINRVRCGPQLDGLFLHLVLLAASLSGVYESIVNTATIPHLTAEKLNALQVPVPPIDVQREITTSAFPQLSGMQNLISASNVLVLRLTERRQALINAAVTGEIDVRGKN